MSDFSIQQMLKTMVENGASDLHITTGTPPQIRVNGKMMPMKMRALLPADTKHICYSILTETQKRKFEEINELDVENKSSDTHEVVQSQN